MNLGSRDPKMDTEFGRSHHEGVEHVVSISDPAHRQTVQFPIMLL